MAPSTEIVVRNYALAILVLIVGFAASEDLLLNVNVKKPVAVVSERFLSITLDPVVLFNNDVLSDFERSASMARALAPAYVRIAGPRSNSYIFERGLYPQELHPDPGFTFSETHWVHVHKWAERAGLNVIACIAPQLSANGHSWDPRNALDLISFSDHLGYNTSWQLGYECQTRCEASGSELGREVQRLRSMLDAFPRYNNTSANSGIVVGPDVVAYKTRQQQQYLQDYFNVAAPALTAVTWHPDFAGISLEAEGVSMHHDNLALEKESLYRIAGRHIMKKPLWIAESKPEECKQQFLGALVWTRRLGNSAKLGVQVLMRQPDNSNLFRPTPDYWVSMLHKMLVGREVIDTKIATGNRTHVSFYSHCTKPTSRYEKGSLTIFGINLTPTKITANIKTLKSKVVHKYILLPGFDAPNRMFAETTLLNNELLTLTESKELPKIQPVVYSAEKGIKLKLPSGGIGFWVLPGLKIKTCMELEDDINEKILLKKVIKQNENSVVEEESNADLNSSRETVDSKSEEQKLKQQQIEKRPPLRRGDRHKDIERNDLGESRKLRVSQLELAKRDLERLDKIMHKRDSQFKKGKNDNIHGIFERSIEEEDDISYDEGILGKSIATMKTEESEKDIRAKLQEYKTRLDDEARRKQINATKERIREESKDLNKGMTTEKVIEALTLITKVENAMKWLERETENRTNDSTLTLNSGDSNDVTSGLQKSHGNSDALLDEVLNSEKSKRTIVPSGIEDQLKALYQLLSDEKDKKEYESRQRRDLDQTPEEDTLDVQQEDSPNRKRFKSERRQERFSELKQRRRERHEQRKQRGQKDDDEEMDESEENEFYGFETQSPPENFPEGDVYVQTGVDSTETEGEQHQIPRSRMLAVTRVPASDDEEEVNKSSYVPNEFYENTGRKKVSARKNSRKYGDLWEADLANKKEGGDKHVDDAADSMNLEIVTEKPISEAENRRAKEQTGRQLVNYYQATPGITSYEYENMRRNQQPQTQYQSQVIPNYRQDSAARRSGTYNSGQTPTAYPTAGRYYTHPARHLPDGEGSYRRTKRHINDLETVLRREMLSQDDNNLKDCQCRVIRGLEECKDCLVEKQERQRPSVIVIPAPMLQYPLSDDYSNGYRTRRDTEEFEIVNENETTTQENEENIENSTCLNEETVLNEEVTTEGLLDENQNLEKLERIKEELSTEKLLPVLYEAKAVEEITTTTAKDELKLEDNSEKMAGNRLPRKIATTPKSFVKRRASKTKEGSQSGKQESNSPSDGSSTITPLTTDNISKIIDEQSSSVRVVKEAPDSMSSKTYNKDKNAKTFKESNVEQLSQAKDSNSYNVNTDSESIMEKNLKIDLLGEAKDKRLAKSANSERKNKQVDSQTTESSVSNKPMSTPSSTTSVSITTHKPIKSAEPKNTAKDNSTVKPEDLNKSRPARLTTRAEALAALRKENENRRAKKIIEQSLKLIDSENAKFEENQRKRREQFEKLKLKLRAKREKMLQQYRAELLEAINESSDSKVRNIKRRDLPMNYDDSDVDTKKDEDHEKLPYVMRYKPIKYVSEKDTCQSGENERKESLEETQNPADAEINGDKYELEDSNKQATPINIHFEDEIYDTLNDNEYRSINRKRSPYAYADRHFGAVRRYNYREPQIGYDMSEEDSQEYYIQQQPQYRRMDQYRPQQVVYDKDGVAVPNVYDEANYYEANPVKKPQDYMTYYKSAINAQKQKFDYDSSKEAAVLQQPLGENKSGEKQEDKEKIEQPQDQQVPEEKKTNTPTEDSTTNRPNKYSRSSYETVKPNYRSGRRSNLKIYEIDPSIYEDDDLGYDLQELYLKPSYRYSPRSYYHEPYGYANSRYKREASKKPTINGPLTFSLGLEKSRMKEIKDDIGTSLDILSRRKRVAEDFSSTKRSPTNKNVKKVLKNYDDKNRKLPKSLQYSTTVKKNLQANPPSFNEQNSKAIKALTKNNAPKESYQLKSRRKRKISKRNKRSIDSDEHQVINSISRSDDTEMEEIWNNIIEMKQDEKLLQEYNKQKAKIVDDFKETQQNLKKYLELTGFGSLSEEQNTTGKSADSTTHTNINSIVIDTIPKIESVITGELKKAQNLTGSVEDFIETIDEEFEESTEDPNAPDHSTEADDGRLTHNVFKAMFGGVTKFFNLITGITRILSSS